MKKKLTDCATQFFLTLKFEHITNDPIYLTKNDFSITFVTKL